MICSSVLHFPRFPGMGRPLMIVSTSLKGEGEIPNYIFFAYLELMDLSMILVHEMKDADSRIMSQSHPIWLSKTVIALDSASWAGGGERLTL